MKLSTALHYQDRKLMCPYFPKGIYVLAKTKRRTLKFGLCHLLQQNFSNFWYAELETRSKILLKLLTAFHCQDRKLICPYFPEGVYVLAKTKQRTLKFGPCHLLQQNFSNFWYAELETRSHILLKLSTAFHCHDRELLCKFSVQAIHLLDKTNG